MVITWWREQQEYAALVPMLDGLVTIHAETLQALQITGRELVDREYDASMMVTWQQTV